MTPNNLTIDAYAIMDVSDGPVVVNVPVLRAPRWFIVQIGDAFDDVICNVGGTPSAMPGAYVITGPEFRGRFPGDMTRVSLRTMLGFCAVRIAVTGSADLPAAVAEQEGFKVRPLRAYLEDGIASDDVDYGPIPFPALTAPPELALSDRIGAAMKYTLPVELDTTDTFVQALGGIGLSVAGGFDWPALDEPTRAGLERAASAVEQIIDERWASIGKTVNGWRFSLVRRSCPRPAPRSRTPTARGATLAARWASSQRSNAGGSTPNATEVTVATPPTPPGEGLDR